MASIDSLDTRTGKKIDAIRNLVAVTQIRGQHERRAARLREIDLRDAAMRMAVAFAMFLPAGAEMPSDEFLIEHAERILNGFLGTTRTPAKVQR